MVGDASHHKLHVATDSGIDFVAADRDMGKDTDIPNDSPDPRASSEADAQNAFEASVKADAGPCSAGLGGAGYACDLAEDSGAKLAAKCRNSPQTTVLGVPRIMQGGYDYLWACSSDNDIMSRIAKLMGKTDLFCAECDALFSPLTATEGELMSPAKLHCVTQGLIDRLGSRDPAVLARISLVFAIVTTNRQSGVGRMEFQGYVASVLTQVMRELEARQAPEAHPGEDSAWGIGSLLTSVSEGLMRIVAGNSW